MRVCLIGGTGFIGSHLIDIARRQSDDVIVFSRSLEKFRSEFQDVKYIYDDLQNIGKYKQLLFEDVDVVIHLASSTTPQESNENIQHDIHINLQNTIKMLDICVEMHVARFIYVSTGGAIYGKPEFMPLTEAHPTNPMSSYAIIKLTIEKYLALYHQLYDLNYTIVRPSNPYGPRQNPLGKQGIIAVYLWHVLNEQPVVKFGDGSIIRDYLYISDLAHAIYSLYDYDGEYRLFNIGSGEGISINQLIEVISTIAEKEVMVKQLPDRQYDVPSVILDSSLIYRETGWQYKTNLEDGIQQTLRWIKRLIYENPTL